MNKSQDLRRDETAHYRILLGSLVWTCAIQFFVAQVIVQAAWTTPFSLETNYISDLGNTVCANYPLDSEAYVCSPLHALMNLSFFAQGVIIILGTMLLLPLVCRTTAKGMIVTLLLLTGLGMLGVGAFTENDNNDWHVYSAALQFVTGNLALVIIGVSQTASGKLYRGWSVLLGTVGLAATALFPVGIHFGLGVGGMERVAAYTFPVWLIASGFCIFFNFRKGPA